VRGALLILLFATAALADLSEEVTRAFRAKDAASRAAALRDARALVPNADARERAMAASAVGRGLGEEDVASVRVAACDLLLEIRTERAFDRLVVAAVDPHAEVREHVRGIVRGHADPMLHEAIVRTLREDASWRLRATMVDLLLAGARPNARRALVDALGDPHPAVVTCAAEALERLTGKAFGPDKGKWEEWLGRPPAPKEGEGPKETVSTTEDAPVTLKEGPVLGLVPKLYTIPVGRKNLIFVVDISGSMRVGARSAHLEELKRALFGLASDVRFNVLCFDQRLFFFEDAKSLVPATTDNKAQVERWVDELPAGQKTDVKRSVAAGLAMLKEALLADPQGEAELFLLTDGRETAAQSTSLAAIEAQFRKVPVDRCRIHVVALGRHGTPELKVFAERTGGRYVEAAGG
jgi:hypothetical protein